MCFFQSKTPCFLLHQGDNITIFSYRASHTRTSASQHKQIQSSSSPTHHSRDTKGAGTKLTHGLFQKGIEVYLDDPLRTICYKASGSCPLCSNLRINQSSGSATLYLSVTVCPLGIILLLSFSLTCLFSWPWTSSCLLLSGSCIKLTESKIWSCLYLCVRIEITCHGSKHFSVTSKSISKKILSW